MDLDASGRSGQLFKTSLEKAMFSSPAACIKSLDERIKKLRRKYPGSEVKDIGLLSGLKAALEAITPQDFTRYQKILSLLRDKDYGWKPDDTDDRIVIFTERIETMKYIAMHLREDLKLTKEAVQEISGSMSDADQQQIVEDFGRKEAPVRVLVASDVASEGLNLHYLSHRLIHFDIPWSLMVFQQRNGRIDRYGQQKRPDIRYMLIESKNKRIKGDMRIIEILITKEEQALKNIGDPSLLLGKFRIEDEELVVAEAIEKCADADAFGQSLDGGKEEFDPFEVMLKAAEDGPAKTAQATTTVTDETLFQDKDYLWHALRYLNQTESQPVEELPDISGLDIRLTDNMRHRLKALLPDEAMPKGETLRLSANRTFCMKEMRESMRNTMDESSWPVAQYLWKLHPVFSWVNDKAGLFFRRGEAPVIGVPGKLQEGELIWIVSGSMPNRKSTPLIDEWFGLLYRDGNYIETLSMAEVVRRSGLSGRKIPNTNCITEAELSAAAALRQDVVTKARSYMAEHYRQYQDRTKPRLDEELNKLRSLHKRHKAYQLSLFEHERLSAESAASRRFHEKERCVDDLFSRFNSWVRDTMEIQDNPYIRIETVVMGTKQ